MIVDAYYELSEDLMEDTENLYQKIYQRISNKGDKEIYKISDEESSTYINLIKVYTSKFCRDFDNYQTVFKDKLSKLILDIDRMKNNQKEKGYMALDMCKYRVNKILSSILASINNTKKNINGYNIEGKITAHFKMV